MIELILVNKRLSQTCLVTLWVYYHLEVWIINSPHALNSKSCCFNFLVHLRLLEKCTKIAWEGSCRNGGRVQCSPLIRSTDGRVSKLFKLNCLFRFIPKTYQYTI